jgi:hypothetical protein
MVAKGVFPSFAKLKNGSYKSSIFAHTMTKRKKKKTSVIWLSEVLFFMFDKI